MQRGPTGSYETSTTAGEAVRAFVPHPLPPWPPLDLSPDHQRLLERATLALGRLDSITLLLPDPHIFLYGYVRREALLSSQIEGTQSSFSDLLLFELEEVPGAPLDRVRREGDWEQWLAFFLTGVEQTAVGAVQTARRLVELFAKDGERIHTLGRGAGSALRTFRALCERPLLAVREIERRTGLSYPTAAKAVAAPERLGIVAEITGRRRNRIYAYRHHLDILSEGAEPL